MCGHRTRAGRIGQRDAIDPTVGRPRRVRDDGLLFSRADRQRSAGTGASGDRAAVGPGSASGVRHHRGGQGGGRQQRRVARPAQLLDSPDRNEQRVAGSGHGRRGREDQPDRQRRRYEIAVEDSGPGIGTEDLPRVFERYYRVEGRTGGGPGGMGLGLAIARGIARAHDGDLVAESVPGEGARFVLQLPMPAAYAAAPATVSSLA